MLLRVSVLAPLLAAAAAAADAADPADPFPPLPAPVSGAEAKLGFLSATLGDHMVLQRVPQAAVVWGHTTPGAMVTTDFNGQITYTTQAGVDGVWRQSLIPTLASTRPYTLTFNSSVGESAKLTDVLFGDVYVCGGQSNMQFSMGGTTNASAEIQRADAYPNIRLFTVGQGTSAATPLGDLQTITQKWSVASRTSIADKVPFGYFSSVCWFFGRRIYDELSTTQEVPIGLISSNWGGTAIELWSTSDTFRACNRTGTSGRLFNAMIHPYTVGPMSVSGFTWYQGETNARSEQSAAAYACLFPAMISEWRKQFNNPSAYFGFIQLSTWCSSPSAIAAMREAQMAALALPSVGYATNADHGYGCNIHPPSKQFCGARLGVSALALQYGQKVAWRSPSFNSSSASASEASVSVTIQLNDVSAAGLTADVHPFNFVDGMDCGALDAKTPGTCAWAGIELAGSGWLNATVSVLPGGHKLLLHAALPRGLSAGAAASSVVATSYGWGAIPLMTAYDRGTGLPVLPWKRKVQPAAAAFVV